MKILMDDAKRVAPYRIVKVKGEDGKYHWRKVREVIHVRNVKPADRRDDNEKDDKDA